MWAFIQEQILGMKWLNALIGRGLRTLGLDTVSRWGGSVQFFLYGFEGIVFQSFEHLQEQLKDYGFREITSPAI